MTMELQENGSSSIATKRAVEGNGFHSTITKKPKAEEIEEYFVCRLCRNRIARVRDLLEWHEGVRLTVGYFRNVFNVDREHSADPGFGSYFIAKVLCSGCSLLLGGILVRVSTQYQQEPLVPGNYSISMHELFIERGNLMLNAVTGQVVGNI